MKRFGVLILAAILGSALTIGIFNAFEFNKNSSFKIEHIAKPPLLGASYTVNENGKTLPLDFTDVSKKIMPAVVHIKSTQLQKVNAYQNKQNNPFNQFYNDDILKHFFGPQFKPNSQQPQRRAPQARVGTGSGVIINEDGYIVTNNHVIENADDIEVNLNDNRIFKAKVIGTDPSTDLALLQIREKGLDFIPLANSDEVEVGEWVLAVGNPFNLNSTVTAGIVSAKGRNINILNDRSAIESFIQTDAAINPGNSGGALVNLQGGLIGINTAIASPTGTYAGYGFAVPSNIVSKVILDLKKYGMVQRGYLGLMIRSVDGNLAKEKDLDVNEGVYVDSITDNSAAEKAGIKIGDVIIKVDKFDVKTSAKLLEIIGGHHPGDKVKLTIDRKGKTKEFTVTLRNQDGKEKIMSHDSNEVLDILGVELEAVSNKTAKKTGINNGIQITKLFNGKIKKHTDIREGFIITKVDGKIFKTVKQLTEYLTNKKGGVMVEGVYEDYPGKYYYAFGL